MFITSLLVMSLCITSSSSLVVSLFIYTAQQLPLPTQTPRTTIVQMKQIPNINDTFHHS